LDDSRYNNIAEILKRARNSGVNGFVISGAEPKTLKRAKEIAYAFEDVYYAAGVHPYEINNLNEDEILFYLSDKKCVAVGECGLDYYRMPKDKKSKEEEKERQKKVFAWHILTAKKVKKPLIIHMREAAKDCLEVLEMYNAQEIGGVFHCFNGSESLIEWGKKNFYFGIGGVVTFLNAKKLIKVLPKIPLERIVLETDSPYLTPHPYRGKTNEPSYLPLIAQKVAEILNKPLKEIEEITTHNAKTLSKLFLDKI